MKSLSIALFVLLLNLSPASSRSGRDLLPSCEITLAGVAPTSNPGEVPLPPGSALCWYYFSAMRDASQLIGVGNKPALGSCVPQDVRVSEHIRILVQYARHHPQRVDWDGAFLHVNAMLEAYTCP